MKNFSIKEALKFGWGKTRDNFGFVIFVLVCNALLIVANSAISSKETHYKIYGYLGNNLSILSGFTSFALSLIGILLSIGTIKFALDIIDGKEIRFRNILSYTGYFWEFIASRFLSGLITIIGFILLIVPGIIWGLMFMFSSILVIDRNTGIMDSLRESANIVNGAKWRLFGFFISIMFLNILGVIAAGIGLIVTIPVSFFAMLYVYRTLLAQTTQSAESGTKTAIFDTPIIEESPSV